MAGGNGDRRNFMVSVKDNDEIEVSKVSMSMAADKGGGHAQTSQVMVGKGGESRWVSKVQQIVLSATSGLKPTSFVERGATVTSPMRRAAACANPINGLPFYDGHDNIRLLGQLRHCNLLHASLSQASRAL